MSKYIEISDEFINSIKLYALKRTYSEDSEELLPLTLPYLYINKLNIDSDVWTMVINLEETECHIGKLREEMLFRNEDIERIILNIFNIDDINNVAFIRITDIDDIDIEKIESLAKVSKEKVFNELFNFKYLSFNEFMNLINTYTIFRLNFRKANNGKNSVYFIEVIFWVFW